MFNKRPKIIRSDRGGEYSSNAVTKYLNEKGVQIQNTAAYSPQQNGVAERKNRTLIEMARCMIIELKLDNSFWGKAVMMANYIQNRLPWKSIQMTPYEEWFGRKPNIQHFKEFGSKCYVYVHAAKRQKLDPKAISAILVGYDDKSKAYRCYNSSTQKVIISRDVKLPVQKEISEFFTRMKPLDAEETVKSEEGSSIQHANEEHQSDDKEHQSDN